MGMLEKLKEYLESEKGKKEADEYINNIKIKKEISNKQLERFHLRLYSTSQFVDFIEKVISKYNSDKYRNFWYNKGYEPPEILYWFLYDYAEKYGRDCCDLEYKTYGNCFTTAMYYINGYYIYRMDGQGSCIQIEKENNDLENKILAEDVKDHYLEFPGGEEYLNLPDDLINHTK